MRMTFNRRRCVQYTLATTAMVLWVACSASSPTAPTPETADVGGAWTVRLAGTQQRTGVPQTDDAILTLRQSGAVVTGTMQYSGLSTAANVSGAVTNSTLTFTATQALSPTCSVTVQVRATVSVREREMQGSYRATTCEDTVVGTLSGRRG